jgi:hypothetical protein
MKLTVNVSVTVLRAVMWIDSSLVQVSWKSIEVYS